MLKLCLVLVALITQDCSSQEEDGPYLGNFIGKLNSYHHQVSGDVYAVDDWTLLLVNFNYDGTGDDTFFWAGDSGRPGPQGFIVPDQHGKTNILERYYNQDVRLRLPEGKRVSRVRWLAVYDIASQNTFGDVYVAEEFEPPAPRTLPALAGTPAASSRPLQVLSATTLLIPEFRYDGSGEEVYFWMGVGPQPSARGTKIPDEDGYLEPLRAYHGEDVKLELPGGSSIFQINWVAVYDVSTKRSLASTLVSEGLNVPPSALQPHPYRSALPACQQLHRDFQVSWEVFGPQVTIELAAKIDADEYMAFGISGAAGASAMVGADVAVASYSERDRRGLATDYNITAQASCVPVLGAWVGVCRDSALGAQDSNQVFSASRDSGLTVVSYRRTLQPTEPIDLEWVTDRPLHVVWAIGKLDSMGEPAYHRLYHRNNVTVHLGKQPPHNDCVRFTIGSRSRPVPWERAQLFDPALRVFRFAVGAAPAGRARAPLAWFVNGQLAPALQLRRGLVYRAEVRGGSDPHSAAEYHPLVVTAEPHGGLDRLAEDEQRRVRVLAGAHRTRRGRLAPTAAGPLCVGRRGDADPRVAARLPSFRAYNRTLQWECPPAPPASLALAPDASWPDLVYYHSFTHAGMGGPIYVVDRHKRNLGRASASHAVSLTPPAAVALILSLALMSVLRR